MTETEKPKPAIDPNLLPEEEKKIFLKQLADGNIRQEDFAPPSEEEVETEEGLTQAQKFFQDKATDAMRYWSQFTSYSLELDTGDKLRIYRKPATKFEIEELRDLSAEVAAGGYMKKGKFKAFNALEARQMEKKLEAKKVTIYLRKSDTNKSPTMDEIFHVVDSGEIEGIIEACFAISMSKWRQAKKG